MLKIVLLFIVSSQGNLDSKVIVVQSVCIQEEIYIVPEDLEDFNNQCDIEADLEFVGDNSLSGIDYALVYDPSEEDEVLKAIQDLELKASK